MKTFHEVLDALNASGVPFAENAWAWDTVPSTAYGIAKLDGEPNELWADGKLVLQLFSATVELWAPDNGQASARLVQTALNSSGVPFKLDRVDYITEENWTHWTWSVRAAGIGG